MNIGLSSYTYTWAVGVPGSLPVSPLTAEGIIDKTSDAGVAIVQIADNLPLEKWPEEQLRRLLAYSEDKKVSIEMGGRGMMPHHLLECLRLRIMTGSGHVNLRG
ncbi:MAG: hypothetical protein HZB98_05550 [Bacteroidia bacterium]|nr:hypothetical protein [Bacteroidia bacterium]